MASTSETGHLKNITNFARLIAIAEAYGSRYAPTSPLLAVPAMKDSCTKAGQKHQATYDLKLAYEKVVGERRKAFQPLEPLATRVAASLAACGAPDAAIEDAKGLNRKLRGQRAGNAAGTPGPENHKTISVSQQSFDRQADFFSQLVGLVGSTASYAPNETELQTASLSAYHSQLTDANASVVNAYAPYANAMIARDKSLYDDDGLLGQAKLFKAYVKSAFGANSPEYAQVREIDFKAS